MTFIVTHQHAQFLCRHCHLWFDMSNDDESRAEFGEQFPDADIADAAMVCDGCWEKLKSWVDHVQDQGQ